MRRSRDHTIVALLALLVLADTITATAQTTFSSEPASRLWIAGHTNISQFTCDARKHQIQLQLNQPSLALANFTTVSTSEASLLATVAVDGFNCGNSRMDRDLQKALQADDFPEIRFLFLNARILSAPSTPQDPYRLSAKGELTIAGVTHPIAFAITGSYLAAGRLRATGAAAIQLTDYAIEAPTRLFGLVRVKNRLTVHFDLILTPVDQHAVAP